MNIFTVTGAVLTSVSALGLVVVSAKWGIREVVDDYTGRGRKTAIAKLESQRDAITGSQTTGFITKYSAVDNHMGHGQIENLEHVSSSSVKSGSSQVDGGQQGSGASSMVALEKQPNQIEVSQPQSMSTDELLRADVDGMDFNVDTGVSEKTAYLDDESQTSILSVEDEDDTFFEDLFADADISETSILDVEGEEIGESSPTENFEETTSSNFEATESRQLFIATCVYNNIEL